MGLKSGKRQKNQLELALSVGGGGEAPGSLGQGTEPLVANRATESPASTEQLMEEVLERENMKKALERVRSNKGAPGVDGMTVGALPAYLKEHWTTIRSQLLVGTYRPQPVRRVEIPKPGGGMRKLGIPSVLDRLIQQAVLQVLQRRWDPSFSRHSYGFRPRRSAHQAVAQAQQYVREGYTIVVDLDLEKFFDRVQHDRLMSRTSRGSSSGSFGFRSTRPRAGWRGRGNGSSSDSVSRGGTVTNGASAARLCSASRRECEGSLDATVASVSNKPSPSSTDTFGDGSATSALARHATCCGIWTRGSTVGSAASSGRSGRPSRGDDGD